MAEMSKEFLKFTRHSIHSSIPEEKASIGYFARVLFKNEKEAVVQSQSNLYKINFSAGVGPISPGIAYKILHLVQKNDLTMRQKSSSTGDEGFFDLTEREKEILNLLVQGLLYKEIGVRLKISTNTAKKHVINIYQKLHVNSRAQALKLTYEKGMFKRVD